MQDCYWSSKLVFFGKTYWSWRLGGAWMFGSLQVFSKLNTYVNCSLKSSNNNTNQIHFNNRQIKQTSKRKIYLQNQKKQANKQLTKTQNAPNGLNLYVMRRSLKSVLPLFTRCICNKKSDYKISALLQQVKHSNKAPQKQAK